jgi:hypothetical protein
LLFSSFFRFDLFGFRLVVRKREDANPVPHPCVPYLHAVLVMVQMRTNTLIMERMMMGMKEAEAGMMVRSFSSPTAREFLALSLISLPVLLSPDGGTFD